MSNFPDWWDKKITIYNKYTDESTRVTTWYKTVLTEPRCFWKNTGDKTVVGNAVLDTKRIICRIPETSKYLPLKEWLSLDDKTTKFTLQQSDIIVLGECEDVINEYESGNRSTDFLAKHHRYGDCLEIEQFAIDTMNGMLFKHYWVRGL